MPQTPAPPSTTTSLAEADLDKAIQVLQAQLTGVKTEIQQLTAQLEPGTSHAREIAVQEQLESANERLASLQRQLDRAVSGDAAIPITEPPRQEAIPREVMNIVEMSLVAAVVITFGAGFFRLLSKRMDRKGAPTLTHELAARFDRLEQAMDAVAIEVERVSEGQRYTTKAMSELRGLPAPNPLEQWPAGSRVGERLEHKG